MPPRWPRFWSLRISTSTRTGSMRRPWRSPICWPSWVFPTLWGLAVSVFMSLAATLAYNYFFLPPVGTFTIADPQNWVALVTFLATSVLASDLSTRARNQAAEANRRRHEVERLYKFSQRLLERRKSHRIVERHSAPDRGDVSRWERRRCSSRTSKKYTARE